MHVDRQCPDCKQWIEILPTTPSVFYCPWCKIELLKIEEPDGTIKIDTAT